MRSELPRGVGTLLGQQRLIRRTVRRRLPQIAAVLFQGIGDDGRFIRSDQQVAELQDFPIIVEDVCFVILGPIGVLAACIRIAV